MKSTSMVNKCQRTETGMLYYEDVLHVCQHAAQTIPSVNMNSLLHLQQQLISSDISVSWCWFFSCQQQLLIKQILHCISGEIV